VRLAVKVGARQNIDIPSPAHSQASYPYQRPQDSCLVPADTDKRNQQEADTVAMVTMVVAMVVIVEIEVAVVVKTTEAT
jgi:hypothetical protein